MRKTTSTEFKDGLNLDLHPIVTPNTVLTDNLNGTFITYNGNEFCLQNDRGNTKVAGLKDGFIPIGAKQYGGIIYIVSTNNNGLTEIGTYPGVDWTNEEGTLNYDKYTTLDNLYIDSTYETKVEDGFRFSAPYSTKTPVTIEIQPSYDGSVNLVIVADKIKPIIINSGFSVLPENRYKLIDREQSVDTNKYSLDRLSEQLNLIRESFEITNIDLIGVNSGGQLKGGNYKFYLKFGDADYNQTDVVAESGIVSIFHGNDGVASTVSGTILDERTDKMVGLFITGLNHVYSKIYIYYSREYSDSNGYRMTEFGMLNDPIDMVSKDSEERRPSGSHIDPVTGATVTDTIGGQTIWITGFEQEVPIDKNELNVDYHTVDFARAEAQQANMLFLGNIGQNEETFDLYRELKNKTLEFNIQITQEHFITQDTESDLYTDSLYYDTKTIYNNLGYYPGEMYRFGIVYVFKDGSTSPVFNVNGGEFIMQNGKLTLDHTYSGLVSDDKDSNFGVIIMPSEDNCPIFNSDSENSNSVNPIGLVFTPPELNYSEIIGWFVVRQKRIPNVICQGLSAKVDRRSHTPVIYDGSNWISQSFLSADRDNNTTTVSLKYDNAVYTESGIGLDFLEWLRRNGYSINDGSLYLEKYTNTTVESFLTPDKAAQALYARTTGSVNTHYWMSDAYEHDTLLALQTYLRNNNISKWYMTKYHLCSDGVVKKAIKDNKQHDIEITYLSSSANLPANIYIDPNLNHKSNYYGINAGSYPTGIGSNEHYAEYEAYLQQHGGSIKNKIIKEDVNYDNDNCFSSDALISLDPCISPTIKTMLDGSKFIIEKSYDVSIKGNDSSGFYQYYSNIVNKSNATTLKAVFINSDTAIKVVDNAAFSVLAGDPTDISRFSYFTTPYFIGNRANNSYKQANNINLIRGKFCPYIGILSNNFPINSSGIYTIKRKEAFDKQDILVRSNDDSEYYCVSKRIPNDLTVSATVFGGDCFISTVTIRIIRNFIDPDVPISENIIAPDAWYKNVTSKYYNNETASSEDLVDFNEVNRADVNTVDLGMWVTFRCLSNYNLGLRSKDYSHVDEMSTMGSPRTFHPVNSASTATGAKIEESWLLNDGYNSTVGRKSYNLLPDVPYTKSEFSNRIIFSNVNVTDSYSNGYRTFQGLSYQDYDKQYGPITKLISWGNNLLCVMEHGIGLVAVNEKALLQTTTGEAIHIYGHGVLSDTMQMISQTYGSKYEHSVIRTPIGVYGIDTDARKVWRVTDKGFETISDMKIESYLNDNLFTDINSNIQTVDVRTHYNAFKGDVMFTFYNTENPYLIIPDYIEIYLDSEILFNIQSNQNDLEVNVDNTEIAEIIMRNNKTYIKGLSEGVVNARVANDLVSKYAKIKVKKKADGTPIIEETYLDSIPSKLVLKIGEPYTVHFKNAIDPSKIVVEFNSNIVNVDIDTSGITFTGILEDEVRVRISYGKETKNCVINIIDYQSEQDVTPTPEPGDEIITDYYTVYIHEPRLNTKFGDPYPDPCELYMSYDGEISTLEFSGGIDIKTFTFKKNSTVHLEYNMSEYGHGEFNYKITSDKMNIYPVFSEDKKVIINSCNPSNATILVNDKEVSVGDIVSYPYGNLTYVEATADGYLGYSEYKQLFDDWVVDINLSEGDFYLSFGISYQDYVETGAYHTTFGAPPGTQIDYTITNTSGSTSGHGDTNTGLSIPVKVGDSVTYTIYCDGFNTINGSESNIQGPMTNRYSMYRSDYYEFRAHNMPDGMHVVIVNGGACWDTNFLHFKAGAEITIEVAGYGSYNIIMPAENLTIDVTALVS